LRSSRPNLTGKPEKVALEKFSQIQKIRGNRPAGSKAHADEEQARDRLLALLSGNSLPDDDEGRWAISSASKPSRPVPIELL
jgi:hypothetical protein